MKLLLAFLLVASQAMAVTRYIGSSASGSGSGADFNNRMAWSTTPTRGDEWVLIGGVSYSSKNLDTAASGTTVITIRKANATQDSAIAGWTASFGTSVASTGSINIYTDDWTIDGVTGGGPGSWTSGHGIKVNGNIVINPDLLGGSNHGDDVTLAHLEIQPNNSSYFNGGTVTWQGGQRLTIRYCYMWDGDANHIACNIGPYNTMLIEYCYFGTFCQFCSAAEHGETQTSQWESGNNYTFRWNLIRDCGSLGSGTTGCLMWSGTGWEVYGNVFYRASGETWSYGGDGLVGCWISKGWTFANVKMYNNTFINIPSDALGSSGGNLPSNVSTRNNYFYNSDTGLPNGIWNHNYDHFQDSGSGSEANQTTGSGNPFVTLNEASVDFAKLSSPTTAGDTSIAAIYRTDWFGNVGSNRGALQDGGAEPSPTPTINCGAFNATTLHVGP